MDDSKIVELFWSRNEKAIDEVSAKYSRYCHSIAYNILHNNEDSEECVSDTYIRAWYSMPPHKPNKLSAFLGKITRNLSLNRYEKLNAEKRGDGQTPIVLDELQECIHSSENVDDIVDDIVLKDALNCFLSNLDEEQRNIFLQRYWYLCSIKEISGEHHCSEGKIKMILMRKRNELKCFLEKEGIFL